MVAPFEKECVCHTAQADKDDFIFMYETVFEDLGISLPFDFFFIEVLKTLRIAPSQLHPNSWGILHAFETVCRPYLGTLVAMHRMNLFLPYLESYKGSKTHYVKMLPMKDAPYYGRGAHPLVLAHAKPGTGLSSGDLSVKDQVSWGILNQLPRGVNYKEMVVTSFATDPNSYLIVIFKKSGYDLSAMIQRVPTPPPPPSPKRKVASSPHEGEGKKAKPIEAILAIEPLEIVVINVGGVTSKKIREADLDPPSLRLGVKLNAHNRELLLSTGADNSLNVVPASCTRTTAIMNALMPTLLQTEKLAWEGLWSKQEMSKLLNDNSELKRGNQANQQLLEDNTKLKGANQRQHDDLLKAQVDLSSSQVTNADLKVELSTAKVTIDSIKKTFDVMSADLSAACFKLAKVEAALASDKATLQVMKENLKKACDD
ncbi:hypothetical protein CR513_57353, partial [Mucuna pruriens]